MPSLSSFPHHYCSTAPGLESHAIDALKIATILWVLKLVKNSETEGQLFFQNFIPAQHTFTQYLKIWIYVKNGIEMEFLSIPGNQVFSNV